MTNRTTLPPLTAGQRAELEVLAGRATHPEDIIIGWWRATLGVGDEEWDALGPRSIDPAAYVAERAEVDWLLALLHASVKPPGDRWRKNLASAFITQGPSRAN